MDKIVIIGANSFQNPLILKARECGFETHVFAWQDGSIGEKTADFFHPISIIEKDEILAVCKEIQPVAVVSIASDLAAITVNYVASALGLPSNSESCVQKTTNKFLMRQALSNAGIRVPKFVMTTKDNFEQLTVNMDFPLIVKPTDRSGSRSITKVLHAYELEQAVTSAVEVSFEHKAIIEEYLSGAEYSFETISYHGVHYALAITKKFTTGAPCFIETAHIEPSGLSTAMCDNVKSVIFSALAALGVENGAAHSEFKIDEFGNISIIEIGARMGGDCIGSHLVEISTGLDFVKMVLDVGMGKSPDFTIKSLPKTAFIGFIMSQKDLNHFAEIEQKYGDKILFRDINTDISHEVIDSSSRYGYYIMAFDSLSQADEAQRFILCPN